MHGEMNRFLMTKTTREMRVVLKYYLNNSLQLLFNENPKILSSKNHLLAHWSPQWPHPELHRIGGRKSEYLALSSIFQVLAFTKPLKGCLGHKMALLSSPESSLSLRNDSFHRVVLGKNQKCMKNVSIKSVFHIFTLSLLEGNIM